MAVASKTAEEADGAGSLCLAWLWGLAVAAEGAGFGDGGVAWPASSTAPQTAIQIAAKDLSRKAPPSLFSSLYWKGSDKGNKGAQRAPKPVAGSRAVCANSGEGSQRKGIIRFGPGRTPGGPDLVLVRSISRDEGPGVRDGAQGGKKALCLCCRSGTYLRLSDRAKRVRVRLMGARRQR
jgi:hypothetical protein